MMAINMEREPVAGDLLAADVAAIAKIDAVSKILEVACRTTGMGFAVVARVTGERWVACAVRDEIQFGLQPGGELKIETTICHEVRSERRAVIIDDVAQDEIYRGHPTPAMYGFKSYISIPIIRTDGSFFGTLCAIDPSPAKLNTPATIDMFTLFAELIAVHLDNQERLVAAQSALQAERENAELREQFIAVLGHDLRNPLASISGCVDVLRMAPKEKQASALGIMQKSVRRMSGLISDVLDFARARLGEGLDLNCNVEPLVHALEQVIAELQYAWPNRIIETQMTLDEPVYCDSSRIAQLLSNLLANALTHGRADGPVAVNASNRSGVFELSVTNTGNPIPAAAQECLFQPYTRATISPNQQGLGLGLYIASEIARAHNGTLDFRSSTDRTCFILRMPSQQKATELLK